MGQTTMIIPTRTMTTVILITNRILDLLIVKKFSEWDSSSEDDRDMEAPCPQTLKINAVIFHHGYSSYRFSQDDIALVQLKPINSRGQCAAFTEQTQPACVPRGTKMKMIG